MAGQGSLSPLSLACRILCNTPAWCSYAYHRGQSRSYIGLKIVKHSKLFLGPFFSLIFIFQKVSDHLESRYLAQLETGGVKDLDAVPGPVSSVRAHLLCGQLSPSNDLNNQLSKKSCCLVLQKKHFFPQERFKLCTYIRSPKGCKKKAVWTIHFDVD